MSRRDLHKHNLTSRQSRPFLLLYQIQRVAVLLLALVCQPRYAKEEKTEGEEEVE